MIKIISVTKKGRGYIVKSSVNETITVTEETLIKHKLFKGNEFTNDEWVNLINNDKVEKAFNKVLFFIDFKMRSYLEIKNYLLKIIPETDTLEVIKKLNEIKLINDDLLSNIIIDEEIRKLKGPKYIIELLSKRGIPYDIIKKNIQRYSSDIELENLKQFLCKYHSCDTLPISIQKEKIKEKLLRLGYGDTFFYVIDEMQFTDNSFITLEKEFLKLKEKEIDLNLIIKKLLAKGYSYQAIKNIINTHK